MTDDVPSEHTSPLLNPDNHQPQHTSPNHPPAQTPTDDRQTTLYYIRSAQLRTSRFNTSYDTTTTYEVRLPVWNCSCPAFAFAAFPPSSTADTYHDEGEELDGLWNFGGVSRGEGMPPVCKHLLACVLVERCGGLFRRFLEERSVGVGEAAGWAAGWGD